MEGDRALLPLKTLPKKLRITIKTSLVDLATHFRKHSVPICNLLFNKPTYKENTPSRISSETYLVFARATGHYPMLAVLMLICLTPIKKYDRERTY